MICSFVGLRFACELIGPDHGALHLFALLPRSFEKAVVGSDKPTCLCFLRKCEIPRVERTESYTG